MMASRFSRCSLELRYTHTRSLRCEHHHPTYIASYHTLLGHHKEKASRHRRLIIRCQSGNSRTDVARAESDISSCTSDVRSQRDPFLRLRKLIESAGPQTYHIVGPYHQNEMTHPYVGRVDLEHYARSWVMVERDRFRDSGCRKAHILSLQRLTIIRGYGKCHRLQAARPRV